MLVIGGAKRTSNAHPIGYPLSMANPASAALEIYDPFLDVWSSGPSLPEPLLGHRAVLLVDGRVLITGGIRIGPSQDTVRDAWVFDPLLGTLDPAPDMPFETAFPVALRVATGEVLVASGADVDLVAPEAVGTTAAALFSLAAGAPASAASWSPGPTTAGIIVDGEVVCVPGGTINWPGGGGGPIVIIPNYITGSGYAEVDLIGTGSRVNDEIGALDAGLSSWQTLGTSTRAAGSRMTVIDEGLRLLFSGASASGADGFGEVFVR